MKNVTAEAPEINNGRLARQRTNESYSEREPDGGSWSDTNTADSDPRQLDDLEPREIAEAAYLRWESSGRPADTAEDDWFWAERELTRQRESAGAFLAARKRRSEN